MKTAMQEQQERIDQLRKHGFKTEKVYIYVPIGWDMVDPKIIAGYQINSGSEVIITKRDIDPAKKFRFILDRQGNEMSVFKESLRPK